MNMLMTKNLLKNLKMFLKVQDFHKDKKFKVLLSYANIFNRILLQCAHSMKAVRNFKTLYHLLQSGKHKYP